ncbi:FAD-dependent oxidoreductase [Rhodophyticola sp. CCM32]|uniref:tRNA (5-methylaminomethyl-2-thiouridine)(34)-methyltransferase MnmD n=1 Tax=Rhodophyticola sp. CCM32 TaxID=2916397 RepID=UPI00107F51AD|nr:tRNA (5-methylaminomethyl-2-thiouridine)(34)-methyltransferase MnmD [Rhodophyticola sp. CCM32]QBY01695.1 FAD-dependent oxidoreductase [Rhodophyticola sp. CCM32]
MTKGQTERIDWRPGDVPVSTLFDDPYYSLDNGLAETRHVFLAGNDLPGRFRPGFQIAELGFGTGLNFLTALQAFRDAGLGGVLRFTSFEAYPMPVAAMTRALARFPDLPGECLMAGDASALPTRITGADFELHVIKGDARETLPQWQGCADAWFLDGFSPARNPELWGGALMDAVARHTVPGGTFATYTAAGDVRRALDAAGFDVSRVPGFGRKRHMSLGRRR